MTHPGTSTHYRACNLCEAICGLEIRVEEGEITAIRGDGEDPFSRGHICPKAVALQDVHHDADRLRYPLRRTADGWRRVGWDEAFDEVADRLLQIQSSHGRDAVAVYQGNPTVHNYGSMLFAPQLLRALGTRNVYSATSVDQLPHQLVAFLMFGHQFLVPVPDIDRTEHFLVFGANPAVSNGSLMTAPDVKNRIKDIRRRGGRVVVIDPRRTETAALADRHFFVRPGSDAVLLLAMLHTIFDEDLEAPGRLAELTEGFDVLRQCCADFTPERVAGAVGLGADEIRGLARDFAAAPSAVAYGRIGVSIQEFGTLCQWLINCLNLVTGRLDRPGGAMFTLPAVDVVGTSRRPGSFGRYASRVRGLPEVGGELPSAVLAEEILTAGDGQIRALVTSAGNPVLSTPSGRRLDDAFETLDFMVSIDFYINETTRHADLILPPTSALEHDHYDLVFHLLAVRNTARYSEALFEPAPDTRHDWQIFYELAHRLETPERRARLEQMAALGPAGLLDHRLRSGPYGEGGEEGRSRGLCLDALKEAPHGIDLGPLEPLLPERLVHPDQRIRLAPQPLVDDVARLRRRLETEKRPAMVLIGRRQVRSNNSWMHTFDRLMRGKDRCTLLMHPDDAERLGVAAGDRVTVRSAAGSVMAPVEVTDAILAGVVSLPHGWGHDRPGVELTTARRRPGTSLNDVTDARRVDLLSGNAALNGVPVEIVPMAE